MGLAAKLSVLIAIVPLIMGAGYAIWPSESKLQLMRPLSLAGLFSGLTGFTIGVMNGLVDASQRPSAPGEALLAPPFLAGFSESMVPMGVAFASLTLAWLFVAFGMKRQPG